MNNLLRQSFFDENLGNLFSHLLQFDILDKAWFDIIRLHPDAQTDYNNNLPASSKRAQKMESKCLPSALSEQFVTTTSMLGGHQYVYMASSLGTISVLDTTTGKVLGTLSAFKNTVESFISIHGLAHCSGRYGSMERLATSCFSVSSTMSVKTYRCDILVVDVDLHSDASQTDICAPAVIPRVSFSISIDNILDPSDMTISITDDGGLLSVCHESKFDIYALTENSYRKQQSTEVSKQSPRQHPLYQTIKEDAEVTEFKSLETVTLLQPTVRLSLTPFALETRLEHDLDVGDRTSAATSVTTNQARQQQATAGKQSVASVASAPVTSLTTSLSSKRQNLQIPKVEKLRVLQHFLYPLEPPHPHPPKSNLPPARGEEAPSDSTTGKLTAKQELVTYMCKFRVAVIWWGVCEWTILGLHESSEIDSIEMVGNAKDSGMTQGSKGAAKREESKAKPSAGKMTEAAVPKSRSSTPPTDRPPSASGAGEGKRAKAVVSTAPEIVTESPELGQVFVKLVFYEFQRWSLSSEVTVICVDEKRALLAMGQCDGCVTVWDLRSMLLCGGDFAQHETSVTQLAFTVGDTVRLISGCMDGSICFFNVETGPMSTATAYSRLQGSQQSVTHERAGAPSALTAFGSYRITLLQFHQDIRAPIVSMTSIARSALVVVGTGKGILLLYDGDAMDLFGTIVTKSLHMVRYSVCLYT